MRLPLESVCFAVSIAKPNISINGRNKAIPVLFTITRNYCYACSNSRWILLLLLLASWACTLCQRLPGLITKQVGRWILRTLPSDRNYLWVCLSLHRTMRLYIFMIAGTQLTYAGTHAGTDTLVNGISSCNATKHWTNRHLLEHRSDLTDLNLLSLTKLVFPSDAYAILIKCASNTHLGFACTLAMLT